MAHTHPVRFKWFPGRRTVEVQLEEHDTICDVERKILDTVRLFHADKVNSNSCCTLVGPPRLPQEPFFSLFRESATVTSASFCSICNIAAEDGSSICAFKLSEREIVARSVSVMNGDTGRTFSVDIIPTATVLDLKQLILDHFLSSAESASWSNLNAASLRLIHEGRILSDEKVIESSGILEGYRPIIKRPKLATLELKAPSEKSLEHFAPVVPYIINPTESLKLLSFLDASQTMTRRYDTVVYDQIRLDKLEVEWDSPLGNGSNGVVYQCRIQGAPKVYALKKLFDYGEISGTENEFLVPFRLPHQHIVRVFHMFNDATLMKSATEEDVGCGETKYLLLEKYDYTLPGYIQRKKLDEDELLLLLLQIAKAIHHLYRQQAVHRDLKPSDIGVMEDGTVKIADFGCALFSLTSSADQKDGARTFQPPEVIQAHRPDQVVDWRGTDIWSLGCISFLIVGAKHPFMRGGPNGESYELTNVPEFPVEYPRIKCVAQQCLQTVPDDRIRPRELVVMIEEMLWETKIPSETELSVHCAKHLASLTAAPRIYGQFASVEERVYTEYLLRRQLQNKREIQKACQEGLQDPDRILSRINTHSQSQTMAQLLSDFEEMGFSQAKVLSAAQVLQIEGSVDIDADSIMRILNRIVSPVANIGAPVPWPQGLVETAANVASGPLSRKDEQPAKGVGDDQPAAFGRSLANSAFKREYHSATVTEYLDELLGAVRRIILAYCEQEQVDAEAGARFFLSLQAEAFGSEESIVELLGKIPCAAQRMWTSGKKLQAPDLRCSKEFCSILNAAIVRDVPAVMRDVAIFVRATNRLCIAQGVRDAATLFFPAGGVLWRGGSLPDEHREFFTPGKKYRVPAMLATSAELALTYPFVFRAFDEGLPTARWRIDLDPRGATDLQFRCKHVNYVSNSHFGDREAEFLFTAYSVFEVVAVEWSHQPDDDNPHQITLRAALDNRKEREDLPLAPWY